MRSFISFQHRRLSDRNYFGPACGFVGLDDEPKLPPIGAEGFDEPGFGAPGFGAGFFATSGFLA